MSDESKFVANFKAGPQYKESILTVRGDTIQEFESDILSIQESVIQVVAETQQLFLTQMALLDPGSNSTANDPTKSDRTCPHGQRVRREGNSSKGPWVGHFCPLPKGDPNQCKPEFEDNK